MMKMIKLVKKIDIKELVIFISAFFIMSSFSGISFAPPYNEIISIAKNITIQQLPPERHWLEQSFLYPYILSLFGEWVNKPGFLIMVIFNLFVHLALLYIIVRVFSDKYIIILIVFLTFGISNTLRFWLGYSDPTIVLFSTFLSLFLSSKSSNHWLIFGLLLGFLSAISHPQQSLVIFFICIILFANKGNLSRILILFASISIGIFAQELYFYIYEFEGVSRLDYINKYQVVKSLGNRLTSEPYKLILGVFGGSSIIIIIIYNSIDITKDFLMRISFSILIAFLIGTLVLDTTRVITILLWPSIMFLIIKSDNRIQEKTYVFNLASSASIIAGVLLPAFHYWGDTYYNLKINNHFYHNLDYIVSRLL